jgi:membrane-associated phospholipid phosphatase
MAPHPEPREPAALVTAPPWLIAGVPGVALLALAWVLLAGLNEPVFLFFNGLSRTTGPTFWAHVTILGDGLVCAALLLLWAGRRPDRVWAGLLGAVLMVAVLHGTKAVLDLPRPLGVLPDDMVEVIGPGHRRGAFPSGHTATAFLYAGVWALSLRRRALAALPVAVAAAVGISRMVVGVHWPSDVLAGAALGWVAAWLGLRWAGRARWGVGPLGRHVLAGALMACAVVLLVVDHTGYPGILVFQRALALSCLVWGGLALIRDLRSSSGVLGCEGKSAPF